MNGKRELKQVDFRLVDRPLAVRPGDVDAMMAAAGKNGAFVFQFEPPGKREKPYRVVDGVAVFDVSGPLWNGEGRFLVNNYYKNLEKNLLFSLEDSEVEAVLFNLDSPGGEAGGMFDLSDAIYNARGGKPIWSIANEEAFSAAYGIASATDRIYVTRTGGVGSVGVIAVHLEASEALGRSGLKYTVFRGGKYKAEQNPIEPLSDHAKNSIQTEVGRIYNMFVKLVARNRGLTEEAVRKTEAQTYNGGENGIAVGFADREGGFERALSDLKSFASQKQRTIKMTDTSKTDNQTQTKSQAGVESRAEETTQRTAEPIVQQNAVDIEETRERAYKEGADKAQTNVKEIIQICELADRPELANRFLKEGLSVERVREKLIEIKADESDQYEIDHHVDPSSENKTNHRRSKIDLAEIYEFRRKVMTPK